MTLDEEETTELLARAQAGDREAEGQLFRRVYDELKNVARHRLNGVLNGTLSPTVLVHDAYLQVLRHNGRLIQNRKHLFAAFARAMLQLVAAYIRLRTRRNRLLPRAERDPDLLPSPLRLRDAQILDLYCAMESLRRTHASVYDVAALRMVLGVSPERTAELCGLSTSTVKRRWAFAKAYLSRSLGEGRSDAADPK